jgi:diketogulonate reductase-like aldo/keto reductase
MRGKGNPVLSHPTVLDIATKHNASAAQVALHWALQLGQVRPQHAVQVCKNVLEDQELCEEIRRPVKGCQAKKWMGQ